MKIAFPTRDDETITRHFGRMTAMIVIDVEGGIEAGRERRDMSDLPLCGNGRGDKPAFISQALEGCDVLIAGGMGTPMLERLTSAGIDVVLTVLTPMDVALKEYLAGTIEHLPELAHAPC